MRSLAALDLGRIDASLTALVEDGRIAGDIARYLASGYAYVDFLLRSSIDIFQYGASHHLLELNHRVLCGTDPEERRLYADHLAATTERFYSEPSTMNEFFDWTHRHAERTPHAFAAGIYVHMVSWPQLFIEGNRRTATLITSYCLARVGLPPLVVTVENRREYRSLASACRALQRNGAGGMLGVTLAEWRMRRFLRRHTNCDFLTLVSGTAFPAVSEVSRELCCTAIVSFGEHSCDEARWKTTA